MNNSKKVSIIMLIVFLVFIIIGVVVAISVISNENKDENDISISNTVNYSETNNSNVANTTTENNNTDSSNSTFNDNTNTLNITEDDLFYADDNEESQVEPLEDEEQGRPFRNYSLSLFGVLNHYLMDYKDRVKYDVQEAYNLLTEDYKQSFGSFENYASYVQNNMDEIQSITIEDYDIQSNLGDYEHVYTFTDKNGNLYNVFEKAIMEYTIEKEV